MWNLANIIKKSIKRQLLTYFVIVAVVPALLISIYSYNNSYIRLKENTARTNIEYVGMISKLVDKSVLNIEYLSQGLLVNYDLMQLLGIEYVNDPFFFSEKELSVMNEVEQQFKYNPITDYVLSFIISGENGIFIDAGNKKGYFDRKRLQSKDWYTPELLSLKNYYLSPVKNEESIMNEAYYIPVTRSINNIISRRKMGDIIILFSCRMFDEMLNGTLDGEEMYIFDEKGKVIAGSDTAFYGKSKSAFTFAGRLENKSGEGFVETKDKSSMVVYHISPETGWMVLKIIPLAGTQKQVANIGASTLLILIMAVLIAYLLSMYLTENFSRPIKKIIQRVRDIAAGDFGSQVAPEGDNEIGRLGSNVNNMASRLKRYIDELEVEHRERTRAEIRTLQNQINPHFLYNTLSSIRYMASIQKAEGIEEMALSLGRLLKTAMGNVNGRISLEEELKLVDDYINIQNIRYRGKIIFRKEIEDPLLLEAPIIKFTLQPFVENSIFHGIEPKRGRGEISINISVHNGKLNITIRDNGMGMSKEKIQELLDYRIKGFMEKGKKGIGIRNVLQRLYLMYGSHFDVVIESKEGEYTCIALKLPLEKLELEKDGGVGD